ncbi:MAG: metal ABC transporter ATP-binding protein [Planctomycetota bacterium]
MAQHPALRVQDLTVAYGSETVLEGATFEVPAAQLAAVVGPNGAGKSTLLRAALGLLRPKSGARVEFFGRPFGEVRAKVAFMPQREAVDWDFPARVIDVVLMGLYAEIGWFRRVRPQHREAARAALARVGLSDVEKRQIGELSGGQQKRVFLARTIVQGAELFLLDEPFAGVDAYSERIIGRELGALRDAGATVLVVHHDLTAVLRDFDYAVLLNRRVAAAGPVREAITAPLVAEAYGGVVPLALLDQDRDPTTDAPQPERST